jgi:uncharacterized protein (TIRG00374 family)
VIAALSRSTWVRAAVSAAVLAYLATRISFAEAGRSVLLLDPAALLAVVGLLVADRAAMIWRWVVLLRAAGQTIPAKSAVWIYLVSSFLGGFTPAGIGADVARAVTLRERTAQGSAAVASVLVDRMLGLLSILVVGAASAALWGTSYGLESRRLIAAAGLLVILGAVAFLWADVLVRWVVPPRAHEAAAARRLLRLADAVALYRGHRSALAGVMGLSVVVQLLRIVQAYVLGRGIGIDVALSYYLLIMPIALLALLLPVSVSGFGVPQAGIVWLLTRQGVPEASAFALSTLIVLSGIVANLAGAFLYLRERHGAPARQ